MNSDSRVLRRVFWPLTLVSVIPSLCLHLSSFRQLPAYGMGLLPLLSLIAFLVVVTWRGNRSLLVPWNASGLAFLGLAAASMALSTPGVWPWMGGLAVSCLAMSFLVTHAKGSNQAALLLGWPLLLNFLAVPPLAESAGLSVLTPILVESVTGTLRLFDVPHVAYPNAVVLPQRTVFFDELLSSIWSMPLFFLLSGLLSTLLKRTSLVSTLNLAAAVPAFVLFTVGSIATSAILSTNDAVDPTQRSMQAMAVTLSWSIIALCVFFSCERVYLAMLSPISKFYWPNKLNPFITLWNRLSNDDRGPSVNAPSTWMQVALTALCILLLFGGVFQTVWWSKALVQSQRYSLTEPFPAPLNSAMGRQIEHRTLALRSPRAEATRIELWTSLHPLNASEISVIPGRLSRSEVEQLAATRGWDMGKSYLLEGNKASWPTQFTSSRPIFSQLSYIGADGMVTENPTAASNGQFVAVHMLTQLIRPPSAEDLELLRSRFAEVVDVLSIEAIPPASSELSQH